MSSRFTKIIYSLWCLVCSKVSWTLVAVFDFFANLPFLTVLQLLYNIQRLTNVHFTISAVTELIFNQQKFVLQNGLRTCILFDQIFFAQESTHCAVDFTLHWPTVCALSIDFSVMYRHSCA
ncbi:hypothetical protein M514_03870 [Trichuris suis]|uniref:Uncharacterized protein n=1 Tax=Trichuris suis TaxID=68888 RepID=A0A085MDD3_9BILA|nr:hypothetical protein M513_03870 [Trichuris suis]KFD60074.1 hypothetical protein M514_03870 [Trichuris suis]